MRFHRYYIPGATVFITQVVQGRLPVFRDARATRILHSTMDTVRLYHPFAMIAYVILPDHFHLLIQPTGESNFSQIMHSLKSNFTRAYKRHVQQTTPLRLWQKRFWDHVIRDEHDMENHLHYIHFNPVKHGLVIDPSDWGESSYRDWQVQGLYPESLAWQEPRGIRWGE